MSKRFGRNQKRRMRQEIAQAKSEVDRLAAAHEMDRGLLAHQSSKLAEANDYATDVADLVGYACVASGDPELMRFEHIGRRDRIQMVPYEPMQCTPLDSGAPLKSSCVRTETLRLLDVKAVRDRINQMMHVHAELADGVVSYVISMAALNDMPERQLIERLSKEIARKLVIEIRNTKRAGW